MYLCAKKLAKQIAFWYSVRMLKASHGCATAWPSKHRKAPKCQIPPRHLGALSFWDLHRWRGASKMELLTMFVEVKGVLTGAFSICAHIKLRTRDIIAGK